MATRTLILLFIGATLRAQTLTVSNISFDGISHSTVRVMYSVSGYFTNYRTRYITSPGTCTDGASGSVQQSQPPVATFNPMGVIVSGLKPDTIYQVCPEVSADYGATWSSGVGATFTTLPLPTIHPAPPIPPETFNTNYPDVTGYQSTLVQADCSDFAQKFNNAIATQDKVGQIINLQAGKKCGSDQWSVWTNPPDVMWFSASDISTSANTLTLTNHLLSEGQKIQIGNYSPYWGGVLPQIAGCYGQQIANGQTYYAHVIDPNTIQVYCSAPQGKGGTLMQFMTQGSGIQQNYVIPLPRRLKWIIVRTATPDADFIQEHQRASPSLLSKMATFEMPESVIGRSDSHQLIRLTDFDDNINRPLGNIRLVGLEVTTAKSVDAQTSNDPNDWENLLWFPPFTSYTVIDRCYVHGQGTPDRLNRGFWWDGAYTAVVDSYFDHLEYFHSTKTGLVGSITSANTFTIAPGTAYLGASQATLPKPVTVTVTGPEGEFMAFFDMTAGNRLTVWSPPGGSATCSGAACAYGTTPPWANGLCNWRDAWPRNAAGSVAAGEIACFGITANILNNVVQGDTVSSQYNSEGSNFMLGGKGPGPYKFENNYVEGAGLIWHHDDSGGLLYQRGDYTYTRNVFYGPQRLRYGSAQSNHYRYFERQPLEWKSGQRLLLKGNTFNGAWVEDTPSSVTVALTSVNGQGITDVDFESNTFMHVAGIANITFPTEGGASVTPPPNRFRFYNNLAWDINAGSDVTCDGQPSYWVDSGWPCANGWIFEGPAGIEDVVIDHNTFLGPIDGRIPSFFRAWDSNVEGLQITNNQLYFADAGVTQESLAFPDACTNLSGKSLADCRFPGYVFTGNVVRGNQSGWTAIPGNLFPPPPPTTSTNVVLGLTPSQ